MTDQGGRRIAALLDPGSFVELDRFGAGAGVVSGYGTVDGRDVAVYAADAAEAIVPGKILKVQELALRSRIPIVWLLGDVDLPAAVLHRAVHSSGIVPQIAVATGRRVPPDVELADVMLRAAGDDEACWRRVREILSYLPSHCGEAPPGAAAVEPAGRDLQPLVSAGVDLRAVAAGVLDGGRLLEVWRDFGFGRLAGHAIGVVTLTEAMDAQVAGATARFIRFCDAFEVPLLSLVHAPELHAREKLLYACAEATVPHLAVIAGRMPSPRLLGADLTVAWPSAEIGGSPDVYAAAERGEVDAVIEPRETRRTLVRGLDLCRRKTVDRPPRKHGNIPL